MKKTKRKEIAILGGGLTGLAAASKLAGKFDVTIIEKEKHLGGLASSIDYNGKMVPRHYHHVFDHDEITKIYLRKFKLDSDMAWQKIKMKIAVNEKIYEFTNVPSLLKFDYLSFGARIRYGIFGAYVFTVMNPEKIDESLDAKQWLEKCAGKEVVSKLFHQLYAKNKFNIPLSQISAKQFAHRLKAKEALGNFGFPKEGLQKMIEGLEANIEKNGGKILRNYSPQEIDLETKTIDKEIEYESLINTVPLPEFLNIANGLSNDHVERLSRIKYCPAVTVMIGTKEFLGDQYWLNILNERAQMLIQHSRLYDGYGVKISWILRYGGSEEDLDLSDEEIEKKYIGTIKKYFPEMEVVWSKVFKEKYASPIYDKEYARNMPAYRTEIEGLYNAGISVTFPKIRSMNTALESGEKVTNIITHKYRIRD